MAAKPKPELKAVESSMVKRYAAKISQSGQQLADVRMDHASIYKDAEDDGLNRWALKQTCAFQKMDPHKMQERLNALGDYLFELGILTEDPKFQFAQGDLEDVIAAA